MPGSPHSAHRAAGGPALDTDRDVAHAIGVPLEVLTVAAKSGTALIAQERAKVRLSGIDLQGTFLAKTGDAATKTIARSPVDEFMAMGAYGHPRLHHVTPGSLTEQVTCFAQGLVWLSAEPVTRSN